MTPTQSPPARTYPVEVALPRQGVFVLESFHGPGFRMEPSQHDFWEVFFVLSGSGRFRLGGESHACTEDDVVVVPPGVLHQIHDHPGRPLSLYALCVAPALVALEEVGLTAGRVQLPRDLPPRLRSELRRLLFEQTTAQPGAAYLLVGRALALLGLMVRGGLAIERKACEGGLTLVMEDYLKDLQQRFFEPTTLDREAERLLMSRRRFTQLFRQLTGSSWLEHLTNLRVAYAQQLLRQTRRSVTAIAFECGFEELSSFYRAFKKRNGMAPLEWRGEVTRR
jgi:AraC-like DNA-binding protein/quercetin dioxygenase-like cupin family protein